MTQIPQKRIKEIEARCEAMSDSGTADRTFCYFARSDIPELLSERREREQEIERLEEELDACKSLLGDEKEFLETYADLKCAAANFEEDVERLTTRAEKAKSENAALRERIEEVREAVKPTGSVVWATDPYGVPYIDSVEELDVILDAEKGEEAPRWCVGCNCFGQRFQNHKPPLDWCSHPDGEFEVPNPHKFPVPPACPLPRAILNQKARE